mgnify:CR=1 FL=1
MTAPCSVNRCKDGVNVHFESIFPLRVVRRVKLATKLINAGIQYTVNIEMLWGLLLVCRAVKLG